MLTTPDETALFLNHRGQRLTRQGLWLIIKRYVKEVGIEESLTPHTATTAATHLLDTGTALREVQERLGHASLSTTQATTAGGGDHNDEIVIDSQTRQAVIPPGLAMHIDRFIVPQSRRGPAARPGIGAAVAWTLWLHRRCEHLPHRLAPSMKMPWAARTVRSSLCLRRPSVGRASLWDGGKSQPAADRSSCAGVGSRSLGRPSNPGKQRSPLGIR